MEHNAQSFNMIIQVIQIQHGQNIRKEQDFFKKESNDKHTFVPYGANVNCSPNLVKLWLGYPKGLFQFVFIGPPHLNMLLKLNDTFILKV
jgi:hypothetical protein